MLLSHHHKSLTTDIYTTPADSAAEKSCFFSASETVGLPYLCKHTTTVKCLISGQSFSSASESVGIFPSEQTVEELQ